MRGSPDAVAAELLWRGLALSAMIELAHELVPQTRAAVLVLGSIAGGALMTPDRSGENGFSTSAAAERFRRVTVRGKSMPVAPLRDGTLYAYIHELAAPCWAVRFCSPVAAANGSNLLLSSIHAIAVSFSWCGASGSADRVFNIAERFIFAARWWSPERFAALLEARAARAALPRAQRRSCLAGAAHAAAAAERALKRRERDRRTLLALASTAGLAVHVQSDGCARVTLEEYVAVVTLPRAAQSEPRLRLLVGEQLALYLDVAQRLLYVARDARPSCQAVFLLAMLCLGPTDPLLLACGALDVPGGQLEGPPEGQLPLWMGRGFRDDMDARAAVAAAIADAAAADDAAVARMLTRAEVFQQQRVAQLAIAEQLHNAVANEAAARTLHRGPDTDWQEAAAASARHAARQAKTARVRAELMAEQCSDESAAYVSVAHAAGAADPLSTLPRPPPAGLAALRAAEPPEMWKLQSFKVLSAASEYDVDAMHGLGSRGPLSSRQVKCMDMPTLNKRPDLTRRNIFVTGAFRGKRLVLDIVPVADCGFSGPAVALAMVASKARKWDRVHTSVLKRLFGDAVVDAAVALPVSQAVLSDVLKAAMEQSLCDIYFSARSCVELRRDPDALQLWRAKLADDITDLHLLLSADTRGALVPQTRREAASSGSGKPTSSEYGYVTKQKQKKSKRFSFLARDNGNSDGGLHGTMGVEMFGVGTTTALRAARTADALRLMTGFARDMPETLAFDIRRYPLNLLPLLPHALVSRRKGQDTPELAALRQRVGLQAKLVAALVEASNCDGEGMPQSVHNALTEYARRHAAVVQHEADTCAFSCSFGGALRAWRDAHSVDHPALHLPGGAPRALASRDQASAALGAATGERAAPPAVAMPPSAPPPLLLGQPPQPVASRAGDEPARQMECGAAQRRGGGAGGVKRKAAELLLEQQAAAPTATPMETDAPEPAAGAPAAASAGAGLAAAPIAPNGAAGVGDLPAPPRGRTKDSIRRNKRSQ